MKSFNYDQPGLHQRHSRYRVFRPEFHGLKEVEQCMIIGLGILNTDNPESFAGEKSF